MKAKTMSKKQGIYFAVCNVVAGLGNYLFQLDASHSLSLVEFGTFTSWIAQVSTVMSLAMFFNYFSNFIELSDRTVTMLCLGDIGSGGLWAIDGFACRNLDPIVVCRLCGDCT
jgi:low temperature requirement protein LtrA